jgi:hypothetical protein
MERSATGPSACEAKPLEPVLSKYKPHLPVVGPVNTDKDLVTEYKRTNLNIRYRGNAVQRAIYCREGSGN